jgi:hypothetical protein
MYNQFCSGHDHRYSNDYSVMACGPLENYKYHKEITMTRSQIWEFIEITVLIALMITWVWYWHGVMH